MSEVVKTPRRFGWRTVGILLLAEAATFTAVGAVVVFAVVFEMSGGLPYPDETSPLRRTIQEQAEAWNRGDLDAFMNVYDKDDHLTFFSGDAVTHGWQATLERYRRKYQAEGREMGSLEFSELFVFITARRFGRPSCAVVTGRWHLTFREGDNGGLFTLVMVSPRDGEWKIVHDHTSAREKLTAPAEKH